MGPAMQGHLHTASDFPATLWARRAGPPHTPGPCPRSLPPVAVGAGLHNGSQWGGGGHQMSPPPHSPRWRPGPHPGVRVRGTGLGPHHHHRGLHHPAHFQRRPGTWKGQRGGEGDVMGWGGMSLNPPSSKNQGRHSAEKPDKEEGRQEEREQQSSQSKSQKDQRPQLPRDSLLAPSLPRPCLLRGKICSRFASSRNLPSLSAPSSGQPSEFSQPPSCITDSFEPVCELSLFHICPCVTGRDACMSPSARQALPGVQHSLCT